MLPGESKVLHLLQPSAPSCRRLEKQPDTEGPHQVPAAQGRAEQGRWVTAESQERDDFILVASFLLPGLPMMPT